mgnify:CR=1 FL=1
MPAPRRATTSTTSAGPGVLADTARRSPPMQIADLAAGRLGAVDAGDSPALARARAHGVAAPRIVVSMTHGSHDLVAHRLGGEPAPRGC